MGMRMTSRVYGFNADTTRELEEEITHYIYRDVVHMYDVITCMTSSIGQQKHHTHNDVSYLRTIVVK